MHTYIRYKMEENYVGRYRNYFTVTSQGVLDVGSRSVMEAQRLKHSDLIRRLRAQLEELESYAYESGEAGAETPSRLVMERQRVVLDRLRERLDLEVVAEDRLRAPPRGNEEEDEDEEALRAEVQH